MRGAAFFVVGRAMFDGDLSSFLDFIRQHGDAVYSFIAIYSMATSSHADAPRGMEFLYNPNRLNVATSRAKCLSIIVGSPSVFEADCRTPRQMQLANAFCRYLEVAS